MNKITPKVIQISDIIQWNKKGELELSPKYQRNSVWNDNAKAYLIDTIIRGLPIPPIFLRQKVDVYTKSTNREIIDGQQRIRAILEFVIDEKYSIKKAHNKEHGGKKYSDLDDDTKEAFLGYEIVTEVVAEKDEGLIYDMFARLNSNNYVLNRQEIRNSKYWGDFKVLVYNLSSRYRDFFLDYRILSDGDCTRMRDVELITSMIILLIDGIVSETPTFVDNIYKKYDSSFNEVVEIEDKFNCIMDIIKKVYLYYNGKLSCLSNKNYFFTFYAVITNQMYGLNVDIPRYNSFTKEIINDNLYELYELLSVFLNEYNSKVADNTSKKIIEPEWLEFIDNHRRRTTSKNERMNRIIFLNSFFKGHQIGN